METGTGLTRGLIAVIEVCSKEWGFGDANYQQCCDAVCWVIFINVLLCFWSVGGLITSSYPFLSLVEQVWSYQHELWRANNDARLRPIYRACNWGTHVNRFTRLIIKDYPLKEMHRAMPRSLYGRISRVRALRSPCCWTRIISTVLSTEIWCTVFVALSSDRSPVISNFCICLCLYVHFQHQSYFPMLGRHCTSRFKRTAGMSCTTLLWLEFIFVCRLLISTGWYLSVVLEIMGHLLAPWLLLEAPHPAS